MTRVPWTMSLSSVSTPLPDKFFAWLTGRQFTKPISLTTHFKQNHCSPSKKGPKILFRRFNNQTYRKIRTTKSLGITATVRTTWIRKPLAFQPAVSDVDRSHNRSRTLIQLGRRWQHQTRLQTCYNQCHRWIRFSVKNATTRLTSRQNVRFWCIITRRNLR